MALASNPVLDELGGYPLARLQDLAAALRASGATVHDFSIGDPDEPTPVFVRDALKAAVGPVSRYPTAAGQPELRRAVLDWLARRHGVTAGLDPDVHVVPAAGSKEAIFHLPLAMVDRDGPTRHVLFGTPGYPVYDRGTRFAGGICDPDVLRAEDGWRLDLTAMDPARLDRACIAWLNYPHNPTGATVDAGWLADQVAVAREHDVLLCSDECYQEVWFDEPAPSVLEAIADADGAVDPTGVLAFVSLSKRSGMTGYRSAAIVGDADVVGRLRTLRPNIGTASPDFVQAAAVAAWSDQAHVEERRAIFAAKRRVVLDFLAARGIEVSGSAATFYVWFRAPGGDSAAYAEALLRARIIASPGEAFGAGGAGWLRLALVPTVEACRAAVAAWGAAIDSGAVPS
jgi:succinyldiaminopimelate transaminase